MLEEWVYIKTRPTVLDTDKISVLQRRYNEKEFWEMVFNFECIKILLTNNTNPQLVDDIMNSEFDDDIMDRVTIWFDKLTKALNDIENAKKKPSESWMSTKETLENKTT